MIKTGIKMKISEVFKPKGPEITRKKSEVGQIKPTCLQMSSSFSNNASVDNVQKFRANASNEVYI